MQFDLVWTSSWGTQSINISLQMLSLWIKQWKVAPPAADTTLKHCLHVASVIIITLVIWEHRQSSFGMITLIHFDLNHLPRPKLEQSRLFRMRKFLCFCFCLRSRLCGRGLRQRETWCHTFLCTNQSSATFKSRSGSDSWRLYGVSWKTLIKQLHSPVEFFINP